jgi:uncharacterized protein YkwD
VVTIALLTAVLAGASPAAASSTGSDTATRADWWRASMLGLINDMRTARNLPELRLNHRLSPEALDHSRSMARRAELFHNPLLASIVQPFGATVWGENVGVARTLPRVLALMMASPPHRQHLVDPRLDWIGIGVVKVDGWLWITLDLHN